MSSQVDEQQQIQFELVGLKRTLEWTEIQREQLLDHLDLRKIAFECPARKGGDEKCVLPEAAAIR